jgi:hypothetical protein
MDKIEIWNAALALLPHDRRIAAEDENSTEAQRCREQWDGARRAVLSAREWGWAVKGAPACCGTYAHGGGVFAMRPPEALIVTGLYDAWGHRVAADAVNGGFRARGPVAEIRYIEDDERTEDWPAAVQDALVAELAARIAPVLADNPQRATQLRQEAVGRLEEAGRQDAQETAWGGGDPLAFVHARR